MVATNIGGPWLGIVVGDELNPIDEVVWAMAAWIISTAAEKFGNFLMLHCSCGTFWAVFRPLVASLALVLG